MNTRFLIAAPQGHDKALYGHNLSRIAPLDQRTALPDQCLHSAEADVRQNVAFWMGGGSYTISTRELLFRAGRADVSANGEWQRNAVGRQSHSPKPTILLCRSLCGHSRTPF